MQLFIIVRKLFLYKNKYLNIILLISIIKNRRPMWLFGGRRLLFPVMSRFSSLPTKQQATPMRPEEPCVLFLFSSFSTIIFSIFPTEPSRLRVNGKELLQQPLRLLLLLHCSGLGRCHMQIFPLLCRRILLFECFVFRRSFTHYFF